jgi:hypothetical protein
MILFSPSNPPTSQLLRCDRKITHSPIIECYSRYLCLAQSDTTVSHISAADTTANASDPTHRFSREPDAEYGFYVK